MLSIVSNVMRKAKPVEIMNVLYAAQGGPSDAAFYELPHWFYVLGDKTTSKGNVSFVSPQNLPKVPLDLVICNRLESIQQMVQIANQLHAPILIVLHSAITTTDKVSKHLVQRIIDSNDFIVFDKVDDLGKVISSYAGKVYVSC